MRLRQWRWPLALGSLAAILIGLPLLIREYIDWAGRRNWSQVKAQLAREGESTNLREIAPPPVPDDQNFCAIPALKDLTMIPEKADPSTPEGRKRQRLLDAAIPRKVHDINPMPRDPEGLSTGQPVDLALWAAAYRKAGLLTTSGTGDSARGVLAAVSKDAALFDELAAGLDRPESQWTPSFRTRPLLEPYSRNTFLASSIVTTALIETLNIRAVAGAQAGDFIKAQQSYLIALRLMRADFTYPFLVQSTLAFDETRFSLDVLWELCLFHAGSADDFRKLQNALRGFDCESTLLLALRGEVASDVNLIEAAKNDHTGNILGLISRLTDDRALSICASLPSFIFPPGWYDANTANCVSLLYENGIRPLRDRDWKKLLARQQEVSAYISSLNHQPSYMHSSEVFPAFLMPAHPDAVRVVISLQCRLNEAIAACALERYRIEHGSYPDTLEAANHPGEPPIPLDIISGKSMGYRKMSNGRYALWCVGFDGKDDGGKRGPTSSFADEKYLGDWMWDFPGSNSLQ